MCTFCSERDQPSAKSLRKLEENRRRQPPGRRAKRHVYFYKPNTNASDDRLKENEVITENACDTLSKLRPQLYDKKPAPPPTSASPQVEEKTRKRKTLDTAKRIARGQESGGGNKLLHANWRIAALVV